MKRVSLISCSLHVKGVKLETRNLVEFLTGALVKEKNTFHEDSSVSN